MKKITGIIILLLGVLCIFLALDTFGVFNYGSISHDDAFGAHAVQRKRAVENCDVWRVAVLGGSGSDELPAARAAGADTYLTGELAYHHLSEAPERGMNLLAAGHFYTENPVCQTLRQMLAGLDGSLCIDLADSNTVRVL